MADFVNFLKTDNNSLWLVKKSTSNMGRGIEMVRDPAAYKDALMTRKDKWGESTMNILHNAKIGGTVERHTINLDRLVQQFTGYVVQRYLERPCLINNRKFDLRCFMVVICCKPYFVYS